MSGLEGIGPTLRSPPEGGFSLDLPRSSITFPEIHHLILESRQNVMHIKPSQSATGVLN
jgi:hypothetical protein